MIKIRTRYTKLKMCMIVTLSKADDGEFDKLRFIPDGILNDLVAVFCALTFFIQVRSIDPCECFPTQEMCKSVTLLTGYGNENGWVKIKEDMYSEIKCTLH